MKKNLLVALLLALCLCLAACELPFDLPFLDGPGAMADYTEVYAYMEDQAYCDAMDALCRLEQGHQ
jgi:hypothetical protein